MAADKYIYADRPESSVGRSGGKIELRIVELKRDQNADEEPRDNPKENERETLFNKIPIAFSAIRLSPMNDFMVQEYALYFLSCKVFEICLFERFDYF